ncbi:MAG: DUF2461 domain-containing protein [Paludibacteraceae bacterium]|jgi:uncharacterized protein (TIGR02453 family)|nr:DUF2461 domain-containing protein [Paludibacteraceae bacterium]
MKDILSFLTDLSHHNDREWFTANKARYVEAHRQFEAFTAEYIRRLAEIEPELATLQPKDCIWRIYRDVRFSSDKRPYKEWFGAFPAVHGGKKSMRGGYYIHLQPGQCMFAAGIWCPNPDLLKALRTEIEANYEEVEEIMANPHWSKYFTDFDTDWMLKKVPAGFDKDFVHADWLKRKAYTISTPLTDAEVCAPDFMDHLIDIAAAAKPMNDFLNYTFDLYGDFPARNCR